MQTLQVMTEVEKPGTVEVVAFSELGFTRQNQAVGFFVRRRRHGDRFKLADWREFSPRWMKFVDEPPEDWRKNIEAKFGKDSVTVTGGSQTGFDRIEETVEQLSMSQAGKPRESGQFNFSTGKVKR